jgi:hypothetical protein
MRRLSLIFGLVLIAALTVHEVYEFLVTNEGIRYFSSQPRRLLYVMMLGVAGGIVACGISRLSPGSQRKLKLTTLGAIGTILPGAFGCLGFVLTWAAPMVTESGMWGWMAAALVLFAVLGGLVWLEFRQVWRQT